VLLQVQAVARRQEAILELLDAMFASDAFERPNLARESREGAETRFTLSVVYLPGAAVEAGGVEAGETDGSGDGAAAESAVTAAEAAEAGGTA
jgi:hypothetical protein